MDDSGRFSNVLRFLNMEGNLLNSRKYAEWLQLLTSDIRYAVFASTALDANVSDRGFELIDEDFDGLTARINQISTPKLTHAENPPTRARRFFSGLEVTSEGRECEFVATSNVLVYAVTHQREGGVVYSGARTDRLRIEEGALKIAGRQITLDQSLFNGALSIII